MASSTRLLRIAFRLRGGPEKAVELRTRSGQPTEDYTGQDTVAVFTLPDGQKATVPVSASSGYTSEKVKVSVADALYFVSQYPVDVEQFVFSQYFSGCARVGVTGISRVEIGKFLEWLERSPDEPVAEGAEAGGDVILTAAEAPVGRESVSGVKRPPEAAPREEAAPKRQRPVIDEAVREILSKERTIQDRHSVMSAKEAGKGFESIRKVGLALAEKLSKGGLQAVAAQAGSKPAPTSSSSSKSQPSSSKAGPAASGSASAASKTPQRVYILLPSSTTAILQLYNTDAFFNKKTFQPVTAETIQSASKPQYVDVKKTKADGTPIVFRFIDATSQLRLEDWENVVGVVAQGQKYQFVHYRWREPTEVFQNVRGFYFKYQDEAIKDPVKDWNVVPLNLSRNKRHQDMQVVTDFWKQMNEWLRSRKPQFVFVN